MVGECAPPHLCEQPASACVGLPAACVEPSLLPRSQSRNGSKAFQLTGLLLRLYFPQMTVGIRPHPQGLCSGALCGAGMAELRPLLSPREECVARDKQADDLGKEKLGLMEVKHGGLRQKTRTKTILRNFRFSAIGSSRCYFIHRACHSIPSLPSWDSAQKNLD